MTTLLHISASPRGQRSESLAIAATFLDAVRGCPPRRRDRARGTSGTARCPNSARPPPPPRWRSSPAPTRRATRPRPGGRRATPFERFAAADRYLFTRADVERRRPVHPQAVHRRRQPARHGLRLRPRARATPACSTDKQAAVDLHRAPSTAPTAAPRSAATSSSPTSTTGCAGPASTTSATSPSGPTSPPPTRSPDAARRTPERPGSPEGSCPQQGPPCWRGDPTAQPADQPSSRCAPGTR